MPAPRKRAPTRKAKPSRARQSTGKTSERAAAPNVPETGALVRQPHGGALRYGGTNRGGTGRPPSAIREQLRGDFDRRRRILREIADGKAMVRVRDAEGKETESLVSAAPRDRLRAIDIMGKYGIGTVRELTVDHVSSRLEETYRVLIQELDPETFKRIDERLAEVWQ